MIIHCIFFLLIRILPIELNNYQYSQLRKNLRASGLGPPDQGTKRPIGSDEQEELLRELWVYLGTDDEGETPYGGDVVK